MPGFRALSCVVILVAGVGASRELGAQSSGQPALPFVEATGTGQVRIPPERALVVLSVETKGPSAAAIGAANARVQIRVLDTLRALGFSGADVTTQTFNVSPNWDVGPAGRRQAGYVARNSIRVAVSQLDRIGSVIDAALARGATGVGGLSFTSSRADSAHRVAIADAARSARADAESLAQALGGSLGNLIETTTTRSGRPTFEYELAARAEGYGGATTPISPGDITVSAVVRARWRFVGR